MTNKRYGRLGDSPVIGVGTYANNKSVAYNVHARYIYQNADREEGWRRCHEGNQ